MQESFSSFLTSYLIILTHRSVAIFFFFVFGIKTQLIRSIWKNSQKLYQNFAPTFLAANPKISIIYKLICLWMLI